MSYEDALLTQFEQISKVADVRVAVVVPCFRAAGTIAAVVSAIPPEVWRIYCVDDASPDDTVAVIETLASHDARVQLVSRTTNGGVGAAVVDGMQAAVADDASVIVKIDSDGQMNPAFIPNFIAPIIAGEADFVKGNRFFALERVTRMPPLRIFGNAGLSFISKLSTGYWDMFDPTNGYIAIQADIARLLPLDKLHRRYFFESDLLFRLSTLRARVIELPLEAIYGNETSHLNELRCLATFPFLHGRNFAKRIFYNYFLRNFSAASISLIAGLFLFLFGAFFGLAHLIDSIRTGNVATAGTVMFSALPLLVGIQFLLNFLSQDVALTPSTAIHRRLATRQVLGSAFVKTQGTRKC